MELLEADQLYTVVVQGLRIVVRLELVDDVLALGIEHIGDSLVLCGGGEGITGEGQIVGVSDNGDLVQRIHLPEDIGSYLVQLVMESIR